MTPGSCVPHRAQLIPTAAAPLGPSSPGAAGWGAAGRSRSGRWRRRNHLPPAAGGQEGRSRPAGSVPCQCDHPHLCRQCLPHVHPGAQPFLSIYFYSQADSISSAGSGFCPMLLSPPRYSLFPTAPARVSALLWVPEHHPDLISACLPCSLPVTMASALCCCQCFWGCHGVLGGAARGSHAGLGQHRPGRERKGPPRTLYRGVNLLMSLRATSIPITPRMSWFWKEVQEGRWMGAGLSPATATTGMGKQRDRPFLLWGRVGQIWTP